MKKGPSTRRVELVCADQIARALTRCKHTNGASWQRALWVGFMIADVEYGWEFRKQFRETLKLP